MTRFSLPAALLGASALFSAGASATVLQISIGEFNEAGNTENYAAVGFNGLSVGTNGFLTSGASSLNDPQLTRNFVNNEGALSPAAGQTFDSLEFRVRETTGAGVVVPAFDQGGLIFIANGAIIVAPGGTTPDFAAVASGEGFFTVTADISALGSDPINNIRLDPIGGPGTAGNTFEVDFIRINTIPEPGSLALLGLGGAILLRRRKAR